jgi:hypothetical protein
VTAVAGAAVLGAAGAVVLAGAGLAGLAAFKLYPSYLRLTGRAPAGLFGAFAATAAAAQDSVRSAETLAAAVHAAAAAQLARDSGMQASYGEFVSCDAPSVVSFQVRPRRSLLAAPTVH